MGQGLSVIPGMVAGQQLTSVLTLLVQGRPKTFIVAAKDLSGRQASPSHHNVIRNGSSVARITTITTML